MVYIIIIISKKFTNFNSLHLIIPIDVQEITTGKYVLQWRRNDTNGIDDIDICAKTTFEMSAIKLAISSLYITTTLPPYGVVRTPLQLIYNLINRTDLLQELLVVMEPSDAFMFSGNKQLHIKILPGRSYKLNFILYPLLPGESVLLPQLKLSSVRLTLTEDLTSTLQRLVPRSITGKHNQLFLKQASRVIELTKLFSKLSSILYSSASQGSEQRFNPQGRR